MREKNIPNLLTQEKVSKLLNISSQKLEEAYWKGIIKKYQKHDLDAIQFKRFGAN
jgi:putative ATP-dependent DNA ligase